MAEFCNSVFQLADLSYYNENVYMSSIWSGNAVYQESVMFYNSFDGRVSLKKNLLYPIDRVLSVRSSNLQTVYTEGEDYAVENGRLVWLPGGKCPIFTASLTAPQNTEDGFEDPQLANHGSVTTAGYYKTDDKNGLALIYDAFHEQFTVYVSYTHSKTWAEFDGTVGFEPVAPKAQGDSLPYFYQKLAGKEPVNVLVYGDSVATGCSSTGANKTYDIFKEDLEPMERSNGAAPCVPTFFEQATNYLVSRYGNKNPVNYYNIALGGRGAPWGVANLEKRVARMNEFYGKKVEPDIIYVLFFSNDTLEPTEKYRTSMAEITKQLRAFYPQTAIVLLSGKMDNKRCTVYGDIQHQLEMEQALCCIAEQHENCIAVPAFSHWINIVKSKEIEDYLSNNINHANDWWTTVTAQMLAASLQRREEADF